MIRRGGGFQPPARGPGLADPAGVRAARPRPRRRPRGPRSLLHPRRPLLPFLHTVLQRPGPRRARALRLGDPGGGEKVGWGRHRLLGAGKRGKRGSGAHMRPFRTQTWGVLGHFCGRTEHADAGLLPEMPHQIPQRTPRRPKYCPKGSGHAFWHGVSKEREACRFRGGNESKHCNGALLHRFRRFQGVPAWDLMTFSSPWFLPNPWLTVPQVRDGTRTPPGPAAGLSPRPPY